MIILTILDGWGLGEQSEGNALTKASTPNFDLLETEYPATSLQASGEAVGLPEGQMGNSEVGHLNLGAGRVVYQDIARISRAVRDGSFFLNRELLQAMAQVGEGKALHLLGLLSDGGVHSHQEHLYALLDMAKRHGLTEVYVHAFLDGRDVPPKSALKYLEELEVKCQEIGVGEIVTVMGRYYAMDRDKRWDRVEKAYRAMALGEGERASSIREAVNNSYGRGQTDEFVLPTVIIGSDGNPRGKINAEDVVIFFNFRADRAREITRAFVDEDFLGFERPGGYPGVYFVCLTEYDFAIDAPVVFPAQKLENTLGQVLAGQGITQLRIAETEKYAHVTFFFNGGIEEPNPGEERILVPSPRVATYDLEPEMSAFEVTDKVLQAIEDQKFQMIILNYANPDMVGHTGDLEAAIKAVEAIDNCLGRLYQEVRRLGATWLVTADHGNVEKMLDEEGKPFTAHTLDRVPFILVDETKKHLHLREGSLQDVAPTILDLLGIQKPAVMTGQSLIVAEE